MPSTTTPRPGSRAKLAYRRVLDRALHEPTWGSFGQVTEQDEAKVREMDTAHMEEFYPKED